MSGRAVMMAADSSLDPGLARRVMGELIVSAHFKNCAPVGSDAGWAFVGLCAFSTAFQLVLSGVVIGVARAPVDMLLLLIPMWFACSSTMRLVFAISRTTRPKCWRWERLDLRPPQWVYDLGKRMSGRGVLK